MKKILIFLLAFSLLLWLGKYVFTHYNWNTKYTTGQAIDELNGVKVYYNGGVSHTDGRNTAADGYNIGMKWQCVEFVKRYYYEYLHHKMPDTFGNAKDFYDIKLADSTFNTARGLWQYSNVGSKRPPKPNDIIVYSGTLSNPYGHVSIVYAVQKNNDGSQSVFVIQQNPGPYGKSRVSYPLALKNGKYRIANDRILGWLGL
jgi:CHAP domain